MTTVRTGDIVPVVEMGANTHANGFLSNVRVERPQDLSLAGLILRLFFKQTDSPHASVHLNELLCRWSLDWHRVILLYAM
jgi:hypothetical protein